MTETERVPLAGAGGNWFNAEKATRWEGDALGAPEETLFRTHLGGVGDRPRRWNRTTECRRRSPCPG